MPIAFADPIVRADEIYEIDVDAFGVTAINSPDDTTLVAVVRYLGVQPAAPDPFPDRGWIPGVGETEADRPMIQPETPARPILAEEKFTLKGDKLRVAMLAPLPDWVGNAYQANQWAIYSALAGMKSGVLKGPFPVLYEEAA